MRISTPVLSVICGVLMVTGSGCVNVGSNEVGVKIVNIGAFGTVAVTVSPNANDMIEGPDITAADDKDIVNTKATANRGDYIKLEYGDANGWAIIEIKGTWARET